MNRLPLLIFLLVFSACSAQNRTAGDTGASQDNDQGTQASNDVIQITQINGVKLKIAGIGDILISYTETVDGYTIVLNEEGIYEYAVQTNTGDLVPGGVQAHNPEERPKKELRYLKKQVPHLRYTGEKLRELQERNKNMYESQPKKKDEK
ncbi:MAG: hypothetical protein M3Q97_00505 [Bacteroidota bacterium]|nr:hypothetical protein [Bacteroidota bacterium]